jgi:excisionase family DNA binding protein
MSDSQLAPDIVLTAAAVAERWTTSPTFVYNLLNSGALPGFKLGAKLWRVKLSAVEAFEATGGV